MSRRVSLPGASELFRPTHPDADETELASIRTNTVTFDAPDEPGLPRAYDLVIPLAVGFPSAGTWIFDVRVNDKSVARTPMQIMLVTTHA